MRPYRHLHAYQLTRGLLAGVYEAIPEASSADSMAHRLRTSAVAAANSLVGISSELTAPTGAASSPHATSAAERGGGIGSATRTRLESARQALTEVAEILAECHRHGHLSEHWYETLRTSQESAAAALADLG